MRETKKGQGTLRTAESVPDHFDVHYKIHFDTEYRIVQPGIPPVAKLKATVAILQAKDGRPIPLGKYHLLMEDDSLQLANLGTAWRVLSL